jgi:hypothetical protein
MNSEQSGLTNGRIFCQFPGSLARLHSSPVFLAVSFLRWNVHFRKEIFFSFVLPRQPLHFSVLWTESLPFSVVDV